MIAVCDSLTDIERANFNDQACGVNFTPAFYYVSFAKPVVRMDELKMTVVERRLRTTVHSVNYRCVGSKRCGKMAGRH